MVKTWTGEEKGCKKIALFPERDGSGEVFYKIEGQLNTDYFMINYYYDKELAKKEFLRLLDAMMSQQVQSLREL
jgi:hypothetical protein